jgi:hypothetical protein
MRLIPTSQTNNSFSFPPTPHLRGRTTRLNFCTSQKLIWLREVGGIFSQRIQRLAPHPGPTPQGQDNRIWKRRVNVQEFWTAQLRGPEFPDYVLAAEAAIHGKPQLYGVPDKNRMRRACLLSTCSAFAGCCRGWPPARPGRRLGDFGGPLPTEIPCRLYMRLPCPRGGREGDTSGWSSDKRSPVGESCSPVPATMVNREPSCLSR